MIKGKVTNVAKFGAFVTVQEGVEGLVHVSEMTSDFVDVDPATLVAVDQEVEVRCIGINGTKISLSMKEDLDTNAMSVEAVVDPSKSAFAVAFAKAGGKR
mmetsp:Transcript_24569/g.77708  ORF Transcript_24569/g.77708 Transcript_24569/m.77708 type:complete len:100 (+) Transcript_24569:764-1063(+)